MHTYIKTFVITYTSIHTYSVNRIQIYAYIQKPIASVVPCWGACFNLIKKLRTPDVVERFLIFGQDKHTKLQTYSHTQTHTYSNTYIVTYICTYYICSYIQIIYIHEYVYDGWRLPVPSTKHKSLFPREMRSGSSN